MTDHTRTEKIGGDFIYFCDHPSRAENRNDYDDPVVGATSFRVRISIRLITLQQRVEHVDDTLESFTSYVQTTQNTLACKLDRLAIKLGVDPSGAWSMLAIKPLSHLCNYISYLSSSLNH